jgi:hypothetical protein
LLKVDTNFPLELSSPNLLFYVIFKQLAKVNNPLIGESGHSVDLIVSFRFESEK